jgi:hypothetical protein
MSMTNGPMKSKDTNSARRTNGGRGSGSVKQLASGASSGSRSTAGNRKLTADTHKGSTVKGGMAGKLKSGTSKTGKQPQPSMAKGPVKPSVIR